MKREKIFWVRMVSIALCMSVGLAATTATAAAVKDSADFDSKNSYSNYFPIFTLGFMV